MGLILDSTVLVAGERRRETVKQVIERIRAVCGDVECALSVVSIVELTHGIYRAKTDADSVRRESFVEELTQDMIVHPVSLAIARLAGRIEGEQAAKGISIEFEDLMIGTTALHLGFDVATINVKHFELIPGLKVVALRG
jgi:tRNA(fMet)-specific endonuclease VapC